MTLLGSLVIVAGLFFYLAGTVGMLRFPDVYSRLHAVTKADNIGLGLLCLGCALILRSWTLAALLAVIWLLAVTAATVGCHLIARNRLRQDQGVE
ncbi:MAG: monovalent cation/H(+) antiporter subunit G [Ectothiorhodospiraceae bacterium]|nr:monovalent cation/H(+) antiporter subunit G [Ectothiorhodospiraceae bacterium]